jgi:multidrug efflux pump subunit AcrA (membrane-fusion protein)
MVAAMSGPPLRRRILHPFVIMPAVALLAVGVWWSAIRDDGTASTASAQTSSDQLVEVTSGSMNSTVSAEGTVAAAATDDLSFTSSGTVTAVNVQAGDTVTAGQVLATIDSSELGAAVAAAESTVADAKAKLADDQGADASDDQIAADITNVATANDSLSQAQKALGGAELVATIDGTVASVDLTVGEQLSGGAGGTSQTGTNSGSGRSSGNLGSSTGGLGNQGAASSSSSSTTAQIQLVSSGSFKVDVAVDAADISSVAIGQEATVSVSTASGGLGGRFGGFAGGGFPGGGLGGFTPGGGNGGSSPTAGGGTGTRGTNATGGSDATASGTVTAVSKVADASSGVAKYTVTVSFTDTSDEIFVGSTVTADIVTATRPDVTQVSSRAVTTDQDGSTVKLAVDGTTTGRLETRTVTTGTTLNGMTEITSGLEPGDQVIVKLPAFLAQRPGASERQDGTS